MNRIVLFLLIALLATAESQATVIVDNSFGKANVYHEGLSVVALDSNNYFVSGAFLNANSNDWKSKIYYLNDRLDTTSTQSQLSFNGYTRKSNDGNLLFYGGSEAGFHYDSIQIAKVNPLGQLIWSSQLQLGCRNTVTDLRENQEGEIFITGFYSKSGCNLPVYNAFVSKLSPTGTIEWTKTIDGGKNDQLHQLAIDNNGDIVAAGWSNSFNNRGDSDYFLVKYSASGSLIFQEHLPFETQDYAFGLAIDAENNIYMTGYSNQVQLIKFDFKGNKENIYNFFDACGGNIFNVRLTNSNTLLILGSEDQQNQCTSFFMETDLNGEILWKKNWDARLRSFDVINEGQYILTGYKDYLPEMYVVKFDTSIIEKPVNQPGEEDTLSYEPDSDEAETAEEISTGILDDDKNTIELNFYPNPFVNELYVKWSSTEKVKQIIAYNMNGQVMNQFQTVNNQNLLKIDASMWTSGTYLIFTEFENGEIKTEKVQKY